MTGAGTGYRYRDQQAGTRVNDPLDLGQYLRTCRERLEPAAFGLSAARRRTPGLRREEIAQRAHVSVTWYTWLEQGRGGPPSPEALERIATALALDDDQREHAFLLAGHRPPRPRLDDAAPVSPRLQRVLDALSTSPAYVKSSTWDVLAWNRAAARVLTDYGELAPEQRNILRLFFLRPAAGLVPTYWERTARFIVATFRAETTRAGEPAAARAALLVAELRAASPRFAALWDAHDVRSHGEGTKVIDKGGDGLIGLEYSAFAVDGRPDLGLVVYTPSTPADATRIARLMEA